MATLKITYKPVTNLTPRTHSETQLKQLMQSIKHFGFTNPVLVGTDGTVIAGHGRVEAAHRLGMANIPTICLADMSEADIRAYVIADNKLAENAGWDDSLLALKYLSDLEFDYDLSLTGFELPEIDIALQTLTLQGSNEDGETDPADYVPVGPAITRLGDVWTIGPRRLICGDATKRETYAALMGETRAQMVFADPPYNVPISGHVCGSGEIQHREFAMASGEMTHDQFTAFLRSVFEHLVTFSLDGSIHFHCMDWRHMGEMMNAGGVAYSELKNLCVWAKTNGGMGSLYRSQHELVFVFKSGKAPHINNVELGKHGRYRTNVWSYAGVNSFGSQQSDLALHPTVKPTALVRDAILDCSHRKDIILDAFAGSGTTLIAAHETGRRGYAIELDPLYCDVIIQRLAATCGLKATLVSTSQSYETVAAERSCTDVGNQICE